MPFRRYLEAFASNIVGCAEDPGTFFILRRVFNHQSIMISGVFSKFLVLNAKCETVLNSNCLVLVISEVRFLAWPTSVNF